MKKGEKNQRIIDWILTSSVHPWLEALDWVAPVLIAISSLTTVFSRQEILSPLEIFLLLGTPLIWLGLYVSAKIRSDDESENLFTINLYTAAEVALLAIYIWQVSDFNVWTMWSIVLVGIMSFMRASWPILLTNILILEIALTFGADKIVDQLTKGERWSDFLLMSVVLYLSLLALKTFQVIRQINRSLQLTQTLTVEENQQNTPLFEQVEDLPIAAIVIERTGQLIYLNQLALEQLDTTKRPAQLADLMFLDASNARVNLTKYLDNIKPATGLNLKKVFGLKDGIRTEFEVAIRNLDSKANRLVCYFTLADNRDNTERYIGQIQSVSARIGKNSDQLFKKSLNYSKLVSAGATSGVLDKEHAQLQAQAEHLKQSLTNLQAFVGVEIAKNKVETVDLRKWLADYYRRRTAMVEKQKLGFDLDLAPKLIKAELPTVVVEQILDIFLQNAVEFTTAGDVTIAASQTQEGTILSIQDSGKGLTKTAQEAVAKQIKAFATRKTLLEDRASLSIAGFLAEQIGGRIDFRSRLHHGSSFNLFVPFDGDDQTI